eukprot:s1770_g17.t1
MLGWVVWSLNQARTSAGDVMFVPRQEPAQLMLIMLMVGFEIKQPLPEPARLMRIMLGLGALARAFEVKQPLSEPAQLMRIMLGLGALARTSAAAAAGVSWLLHLVLMLTSPNPARTSAADAHNAQVWFRGRIMLGLRAVATVQQLMLTMLGFRRATVLPRLGWVMWWPNQARTSAADAHNAQVRFRGYQPWPEPAQLMRIVLGLGVAQQFVLAMLGWVVWSHNQARTSAADAHNAQDGFRGHPTIARTSMADARYARLGCPCQNLQEPAQLMLIMPMVGFEVKQPLPEPARLMRIMLRWQEARDAGVREPAQLMLKMPRFGFDVTQPSPEPAQLMRIMLGLGAVAVATVQQLMLMMLAFRSATVRATYARLGLAQLMRIMVGAGAVAVATVQQLMLMMLAFRSATVRATYARLGSVAAQPGENQRT